MCLLCWLGRLPSYQIPNPLLLIPPNSQHFILLIFHFFPFSDD